MWLRPYVQAQIDYLNEFSVQTLLIIVTIIISIFNFLNLGSTCIILQETEIDSFGKT